MKKLLYLALLMVLLIVGLQSCGKDKTPAPSTTNTGTGTGSGNGY